MWLWYMDDVVEVIKKDKMDEFMIHLNSKNPSIKFMVEHQEKEQGDQHLPVLNVDIIREKDRASEFKI